MNPGKYVGKAIGRGFVILFIIALLAVGAFAGLRGVGKSELYHNAKTTSPVLSAMPVSNTVEGAIVYNGANYKYNEDILTFLVMGVDSLEPLPKPEEVTDYTLGGQADTLFLVVINPHTEDIKVVAINRNSMTEVDVYDPQNNYARTDYLQVCLQHGYGSGLEDSCERQVDTVSRMFFDLPIHGYVAMNMAAVSILNDAAGGITVEVLENVPWGTDVIAEGLGNTVTLEGMDAYYYLQYRDVEIFDSASMRLARQKQYLNAFAQKTIAETKRDVRFPLQLFDAVEDYLVTDVNTAMVLYLASTYLGYTYNPDGIYVLEGETAIGGGGFEEFYVDDEALYDLIINIFYEKVS